MSGAGPRFALSSPPYEATLRLIPGGMTGRGRKRIEREWAGRGRERRKRPGREQREKEGRRKLVPVKSYRARARHQQPPPPGRASMDPLAGMVLGLYVPARCAWSLGGAVCLVQANRILTNFLVVALLPPARRSIATARPSTRARSPGMPGQIGSSTVQLAIETTKENRQLPAPYRPADPAS